MYSRILGVFFSLILASGSGLAGEVRVLTAGAYKPVLLAVADQSPNAETRSLRVDNDTAGALSRRIEGGEVFDLAILPLPVLESLAGKGLVRKESIRPLARVGVGVAVKEGAAAPRIDAVEAFRAALLTARSVAYIDPAAGGSSGVYLNRLFGELGVKEALAGKSVLVPGGLVAKRLLTGEAELAIHQISEILAVPGVTLVGPLPASIQNYTVYGGAVATGAAQPTGAEALLAELADGRQRAILESRGMELPPR